MKKLKKIFISLGVFIMSLITKVYALTGNDINNFQDSLLYGVPKTLQLEKEPNKVDIFINGVQITLTIIPFIIGLIVLFSKKLSKKTKIISISILLALIIIANLIALIYNNSQM